MSKRISVLVIEDEQHVLNILEHNLKLDGFDVFLADGGHKGLELAHQVSPDVILLDWMMPEMDGLQVLSQLKKDPKTRNIPVFMLTAKKTPLDVGQAICEGVDGYFTKPFDAVKLARTLRHKLENPVKG